MEVKGLGVRVPGVRAPLLAGGCGVSHLPPCAGCLHPELPSEQVSAVQEVPFRLPKGRQTPRLSWSPVDWMSLLSFDEQGASELASVPRGCRLTAVAALTRGSAAPSNCNFALEFCPSLLASLPTLPRTSGSCVCPQGSTAAERLGALSPQFTKLIPIPGLVPTQPCSLWASRRGPEVQRWLPLGSDSRRRAMTLGWP